MTSCRSCTRWTTGLIGILLVLTSCTSTSDTALRALSPAEQAEFATYRQVMTGAQARTYLAKASAAERTAYLRAIGVAQRWQRLDPLDREAVQSGAPRVGMSADTLRFVWGDPAATAGDARAYARWHYLGSSLGRSKHYHPWDVGNRVEVYLAHGKVVGWVDTVPEDSGGGERAAIALGPPSRAHRHMVLWKQADQPAHGPVSVRPYAACVGSASIPHAVPQQWHHTCGHSRTRGTIAGGRRRWSRRHHLPERRGPITRSSSSAPPGAGMTCSFAQSPRGACLW